MKRAAAVEAAGFLPQAGCVSHLRRESGLAAAVGRPCSPAPQPCRQPALASGAPVALARGCDGRQSFARWRVRAPQTLRRAYQGARFTERRNRQRLFLPAGVFPPMAHCPPAGAICVPRASSSRGGWRPAGGGGAVGVGWQRGGGWGERWVGAAVWCGRVARRCAARRLLCLHACVHACTRAASSQSTVRPFVPSESNLFCLNLMPASASL